MICASEAKMVKLNKIKRLSTFAGLIAISFLLLACSKQDTHSRGSVKTINGVVLVNNSLVPLYADPCFRLEKEIQFGETDTLSKISYAVDEDENLFLLDRVNNEIRIYNKQGVLLTTFGKKGQGPGELEMPVSLQVSGQGEIMIREAANPCLKIYSQTGKYLRKESLFKVEAMILSITKARNGDYIMLLSYNPWKTELRRYDQELNASRIILKRTYEPKPQGQVDLSRPDINYAVDKDSNVICGTWDRYELFVSNPEGKVIKKITKSQIDKPYPEYERKRVLDLMQSSLWFRNQKIIFPKYQPAFTEIIAADDGKLYALVYGPKDMNILEIFDKDGFYLGNAQINHRLSEIVIKNNKLYGIEYNDEDYAIVKRYEMIWNFQASNRKIIL
jgi:hypothetical protein